MEPVVKRPQDANPSEVEVKVKNYPFQKFVDEYKHLDNDESRHLMKPVVHVITQDFKGQEHLYCDKGQLCPFGKYRRPKKLIEAESRGFTSVAEMVEADKKAEEDAKQKKYDDQQKELDELKAIVRNLIISVSKKEST